MRRNAWLPRARRTAAAFVVVALVGVALAGLQGCKGKDAPNTVTSGLVESTGTVQATASVEATGRPA